ncbi:MAG: aspartyl protease family protein [Bacteroidota bacterium]
MERLPAFARIKVKLVRATLLLTVIALFHGCIGLKNYKLMHSGSVEQTNFLEKIPFEFRVGVPVVKAKINGKEGWFLFDTGAPNVISTEFRDELLLETKLKNKVTDSGGNVAKNQDYVSIEKIEIGSITFENTAAIVQNLRTSDMFKCIDIDGIIGANLMRQAFWNLDYKNQEITFSDSLTALALDSSYIGIDFIEKTQGTPLVSFTLNGFEAKKMTFDTGSNRGLSFPLQVLQEMRDSLDLKESIEVGSTTYGVGGKSKVDSVFHVRIDSISMGELQLPSSVIGFDQHSNTFGTEVLENFDVILDWESDKVYMKPISDPDLNLETHGFGIHFTDGQIRVGSIYADSEAAEKLQLGDRILNMEEFELENLPFDEICSLLLAKTLKLDNRPSINLAIDREGERVEVELKRVKLL